jgi:hypothetical protein
MLGKYFPSLWNLPCSFCLTIVRQTLNKKKFLQKKAVKAAQLAQKRVTILLQLCCEIIKEWLVGYLVFHVFFITGLLPAYY